MDLPAPLLQEIRDGNVVLMLGAGSSREAESPDGKHPPGGKDLGQLLADRFLSGGYEDYSLSQISELAISETDLGTVQDFIAQILAPFQPSKAHLILTTFRWCGVATTNYDELIERAYKQSTAPAQTLVPFIGNGDRVDEKVHRPNPLQYLKLHGCVSRTHSPELPFILTPDQYVHYRKGRSRLFKRFQMWAGDRTVIFLGYGIQDPNLRAILLELDSELSGQRPRYFTISKSFTSPEQRFWESKRITAIEGTFGDFFEFLDASVASAFRGVRPTTPAGSLAISERFAKPDTTLSENCRFFLENDVDYVRAITAVEKTDPRDFYRGLNRPWSAIEQELDVRRRLVDTILTDTFLTELEEGIAFSLVTAEAGAGKSVLLQRLAWDAAKEHDCLCLYLRPTGMINAAALAEIAVACDERVFFFVDDALAYASELERLIKGLQDTAAKVTVVSAARTNEWNVYPGLLPNYVADEYELHYLSEVDVEKLLLLLEKHHALYRLEDKTPEERREAFVKRAGRQLLVALHEATLGRPFEEIVRDEYLGISPPLAQSIYKTICVLFRFNAPVRAGVVSRIHNITFEDFKKTFFSPLENVVQVIKDQATGDFSYVARHAHIAEIVFQEVLNRTEDRYAEYIQCLQHLDVDYASDRKAFNQMVRGRALLDMFPNPEMVYAIFKIAEEKATDSSLVYHQRAIYEMHRPGGDLAEAARDLDTAEQLSRKNTLIEHSRAELALRRARETSTPTARRKFLNDAEAFCRPLVKISAQSSYARHTLVKIGICRLKDALESDNIAESELTALLTSVEKELSQHLVAKPGDAYLLSAEAELAEFLAETTRATSSLEKAFQGDPRNTYVALALSRLYRGKEDFPRARAILTRALEANPNDQRLHSLMAKVLWDSGHAADTEIRYHSRRSFSPGDSNFDGQLLHARQVYVIDGPKEAKSCFQPLKSARVSSDSKTKIQYPLPDAQRGEIVQLEATYCFIRSDANDDRIYAYEGNFASGAWDQITFGSRVSFRLGFTMKGPSAFEVQISD